MKNTIGSKLVQIAVLRVDALRRLLALAPPGESCELIRAQLAEAEQLLRYRLNKFSGSWQSADMPAEEAPPTKQVGTP